MGPKAGVFCHNGLGDGVVSLVLSNNLHLNGWRVETFQNATVPLQHWVPHLPLLPYPPLEEIESILHRYDWFFVVHNDTSEFIQRLVLEGKRRYPDQMKIIYIYPSKRIVREPYYRDTEMDPDLPVAENLRLICEKILHLPKSTKSNGFIPPPDLRHRFHKRRIALHPTGSRRGKRWAKEKFIQLALRLRKEGFDPIWIIGPEERSEWLDLEQHDFSIPEFPTLDELTRFIYESGYLLGNDSGLGHLASFLGVPTLTITRRKALARLWAPSYTPGTVVTPPAWIPNIRGLRLRDRYWQSFISVEKVLFAFDKLTTRALV